MQLFVHGYRARGTVMLAAFPAVMLAVCPVMDAPFYAAKCTVLFVFGAVTCLFVSKASPPAEMASVSGTDHLRLRVLQWCCGGLILAALLATAHAHAWETAWRPLSVFGAAIGAAAALIRLRVAGHRLLLWMAVSSVVLSCLVLAGWAGYDLPRLLTGATAPGRMRTAASLGNPLFVASFLSTAMWSICALHRMRVIWRAGLLLFILLALAATGERTAIVGVLAGAVCWLASGQHKPKRLLLSVALTFIAITGLFATTRVLNPRSIRVAANGRIFLWKTSLHHLHLLGAGVGSFYNVYAENLRELAPNIPASNFIYAGYESQAHNLFVQQIVEIGTFGCVSFLAALAIWFATAWKDRRRADVRAALAGTAAFLAVACSDDPLDRPEGMLLLVCWMVVPYLRSGEDHAPAPVRSSRQPRRWPHRLMPLCSIALLIAAAANTVSYAIYSGERAEQLARWSLAEHWLRLALTVDPAAKDAHFDLVRVLCESGDYEACWTESGLALRWVNEAELHLLRIRVLQALGRDQAAQQELTEARQQFPWSRELRTEQIASTSTPISGY